MNLYFAHGKTPLYKGVVANTADTTVIWTPTSGKRIVITGIMVSNNAGAGISKLFFGSTNSGPTQIVQYNLAASTTLAPYIGPIDSIIADYILYATSTSGGTNGQSYLITGFED